MTKPLSRLSLDAKAREFVKNYIRSYQWLEDLCNEHSVSPIVFDGLLDFLDQAQNMQKENHELTLALVLKNDNVPTLNSIVNLRPFHISCFQRFSDLKNAINGEMLYYLIDESGEVFVSRIPPELMNNSARSIMEKISYKYDTISIYLENKTLFVFGSGVLVQIKRDGKWMQPCFIPLDNLSRDSYPYDLLKRVLQLCNLLSERKEGGLFVISKDDDVRFCQSLNNDCKVEKQLINLITDEQLVNLANLDGAIILNINGELLKIGQKLDAPSVGEYYQEPGRGTKHNAASKYSKATDSLVFVVSEDGAISIYYKGALFGRCYGELFGERVFPRKL